LADVLADWLVPFLALAGCLLGLALAWGMRGGRRKLTPIGGPAHRAALAAIAAGVGAVVLSIVLPSTPPLRGRPGGLRHAETAAYVGYGIAMLGALAAAFTRPSRRQIRRLRREAARRDRAAQRAARRRAAV
jgi:hypothetical protein